MRRVIGVLLLASLMAGCTAWPEKKKTDWKSTTRTERLNELFWDDVANKKWSAVKDHLAPLAVLTEADKKTTGAKEITTRLESLGVSGVQVGEVESQPAGADLVTSYVLATAGRPPMRVLAVWQPAGNRMVVVALSLTVTSQ